MNKRNFLGGAATGAAALSAVHAAAPVPAGAASATGGRGSCRASRLETSDETQLFRRDWGSGRPIVVLASWSLPS